MRRVLLGLVLLLTSAIAGCGDAAPEDPGAVGPEASDGQLMTPAGGTPFERDK